MHPKADAARRTLRHAAGYRRGLGSHLCRGAEEEKRFDGIFALRTNTDLAGLGHHRLCRSRRTGNARSSCWQRLQASRIDGLSALGAASICAFGYSLQGGFNLMDFGSLGFAYTFRCFLIVKFNGLVLGISRQRVPTTESHWVADSAIEPASQCSSPSRP